MIYLLGLLLVVYFAWRFGGLFVAWRAAGYPADPAAARSVRFMVGVILTTVLVAFFLWMSPRVTPGLVLSIVFAAVVVIGMQFIRENLARDVKSASGRGRVQDGAINESSPPTSSPPTASSPLSSPAPSTSKNRSIDQDAST
jgi:fatty acid desaturase